MNKLFIFTFLLLAPCVIFAQPNHQIKLLIRADDIGSFHAANLGCIDSYKNGIARSVEIMPPTAWFPEAVKMLNDNPGYDVGIHLVLTSEWSNIKWRPLTHCPSLVDKDGYFYPMVWKNPNFPKGSSIQESNWKLEEIEQELRAQIELSLKYIPRISHLSAHMGFSGLNPKIGELVDKLAKEYKLDVDMSDVKRFSGWGQNVEYEDRVDRFCENLESLTPGTYLFVEHPAAESTEMATVGHKGYENVGDDRKWVLQVFTSEKVKETIRKKNIKLISYSDLK